MKKIEKCKELEFIHQIIYSLTLTRDKTMRNAIFEEKKNNSQDINSIFSVLSFILRLFAYST